MKTAISIVEDNGMSHIPATSIVFGFLGLSCAIVVGFVSALQNGRPDSTEYGYEEPMESGASYLSPSSAEVARCDAARALASSLAAEISNDAIDARAIPSSSRPRIAPGRGPEIAD